MSNRESLIQAFLQGAGWGEAQRGRLAGDASFRHYDRLNLHGRPAVLMDAPPPQEDVRPFVRIARHLTAMGLSAPGLLAVDEENGLLLLEDLGDGTYTRLLAQGQDETALYALATDVLVEIARQGAAAPEPTPAYDDARLLTEAGLLTGWYLPAMTGQPTPPAIQAEYDEIWRQLLPVARMVPDTLVLRDFHVDNLMLLDRPGLAACGLLDFQDAVVGPLTYDLMSLLEDARRDIDPVMAETMKIRFLKAFPQMGRTVFEASWAVMAANRHAKVIGIFTRLCRRDGKPGYLVHIPRVWRLLEAACAHPILAGLRHWLDRNIPREIRGVPSP